MGQKPSIFQQYVLFLEDGNELCFICDFYVNNLGWLIEICYSPAIQDFFLYGLYSGLRNPSNVWDFWTEGNVVPERVGLVLSTKRIKASPSS